MTSRAESRAALIDGLADHLLAHGVAGSSLKALAGGVGASDRMLLYYFDSKEGLLEAALERVAQRLTQALDVALPPGNTLDDEALLSALWALLSAPSVTPFMGLWLELAAAAARGTEPQRRIGGAIADGFLSWIGDRLDGAEGRAGRAARVLATIDGMMLLEAIGRPAAARQSLRPAAE